MNIRQQTERLEAETLSEYASFSARTRGRDKPAALCDIRTEYQRDRDKIIHCKSFRRLMNKTQVFLSPEGDHYRTRLTHTLEVCQIARTISRALRLNEDLTEAIALGHDLGHTPFGHAGEEVLSAVSSHGYIHARQSVRVVETLENEGQGLNLTWEVRNGILCHSGGEEAATLEGRVVRYADKIAYMNHDIDDAVHAGVLCTEQIPQEIREKLGDTKSQRITTLINAVVQNSGKQIQMDAESQRLYNLLRDFMFQNVYTSPVAKREENKAKGIVRALYEYFVQHPAALPPEYLRICEQEDVHRAACDYISGMTDRYCIALFERLYVPKSWPVQQG